MSNGFSWHRLLIPSFALWYILSLIYWRLCLQVMPQKWLDNPKTVLCVSFLCSLFVGFIPLDSEMSFQRAIVFWPFFIMGYYLKQSEGTSWLRQQNKWIAGSVLLIMLLIAYFYMPPFYANTSYAENKITEDFLLRFGQLAIAVAICFSIIVLIPERLGKITDIGKYTLIIYLLHPPIVKTLKVISVKIGYQPDLLMAVLITAFTVILICFLRRLKIFKYIV